MCFVGFAVKEYPKHPPTMSCSAEPGSVTLGGSSQITCSCGSPDNVPLTIGDWQATSGTLSPNGNVATLQTAGVTASSIEVRSRCSDARGLLANAMVNVHVEAPPPPPPITPEVQRLEARLALHSIYFPTAQPPPDNPQGGLLPSQQQTLVTLASDFLKYIDAKPDARLVLEGHADVRGSVEYNQGLSERRVNRARQFLIDRGVPADKLDTRAFGKQRNLSDAEVTDSIQHNPELSAEERARILRNLRTIGLANNRRVDITLFATGQTSVRQYPFNAADSLTLIGGREGAAHKKPATKTRKRR